MCHLLQLCVYYDIFYQKLCSDQRCDVLFLSSFDQSSSVCSVKVFLLFLLSTTLLNVQIGSGTCFNLFYMFRGEQLQELIETERKQRPQADVKDPCILFLVVTVSLSYVSLYTIQRVISLTVDVQFISFRFLVWTLRS